MDSEKIQTFWRARTSIDDPRIATNLRVDGRLELDASFVKSNWKAHGSVLDLGAGTCTLAGLLHAESSVWVAVDKYPEFLAKAPVHASIETVSCDVRTFIRPEKFDNLLLFGVVNYLSAEEEADLYRNCSTMIADDGVFLVKNQCGLEAEVVVDHFSTDLGCNYHARYPSVKEQRELLEEHFLTELVDVYPPSLNRWENTHFFGFVCRPRTTKVI
jgi:cyclopropane fatty-acyl-phospholipid synthase-like methyltransferase